jgi:hypothetical protein
MKIRDLYAALCGLYGRPPQVDIDHFLLLVHASDDGIPVGSGCSSREALFIRHSDEGMELGLYLAPEIVAELEFHDPLDRLEAFACVAEGISHFHYVYDRAASGRSVSQLELELQGEVDKFLLIHLLASARRGDLDRSLFDRQFAQHRYDPRLTAEELERYESASHFAAKFCAELHARYFNPLRLSELIACARDFFARGLGKKVALVTP